MRRIFTFLLIAAAAAVGFFFWQNNQQSTGPDLSQLQTDTITRGPLSSFVGSTGSVHSNQTTVLNWTLSGQVEEVFVVQGQEVKQGDVLAVLKTTSLPQYVILADANRIAAEQALENAQDVDLQRAFALKAVQDAEQALEDAKNPVLAQAQAQTAIATAEQSVARAERNYKILTNPPSQQVIDQANATILLAEDQLAQTDREIARFEKRASKPDNLYEFWESRKLYQGIVDQLKIKRNQELLSLQRAQNRYDELINPPDPLDVQSAQAAWDTAKAQLADAQRRWERIKDGVTPAQLALLETNLDEARQNYADLEIGPDPDQIAVLEAQVDAANAALAQTQISAPFDGIITDVYPQPGDLVSIGAPAFQLDDFSRLLIDVPLAEVDIPFVEIGQSARALFDAILDTNYEGVVVEVSPVAELNNGISTFTVVIELVAPDGRIRPGMTAGVNITIAEKDDVLLIPNRAVRTLAGQRVAYVIENGDLVPVPIELAIVGEEFSELTGGALDSGDTVVVNPPVQLLASIALPTE